MKIEDIKPGDVLFRSKDGKIVKVDKVTPDGLIQLLAYSKMEKSFHIYLTPIICSISAEYYEPATEEQRYYINRKLMAFSTDPHAKENERLTALATIMSDLKQENDELVERIKQLMDDYNRVAKQLRASHTLSNLTEVHDKLEEFERENKFLRKKLESLQEYNDLLYVRYDAARAKLQKTKERCNAAEVNYNDLRQLHNEANRRIERLEQSEFESVDHICPHGVKAKVGSLVCFNCKHFIKSDLVGNTGAWLCAYNYDKKEESDKK